MTEFTKEFIEKQREQIKFISPLPWTACSCGKCGSISNKTDPIAKVTMGNWGDDYPDIRRIGGSIEGKFETFMNQITYGDIPKETATINAQYIANACNNYPEALDETERLQARVQELEQERRWIPVSEPVEGNNLEILCYSNDAPHYECYFAIYIDGIFGEYESGKFLEIFPKPTHYMYKPKPPKYKPPQPPQEAI